VEAAMVDREKVLSILQKRFPNAPPETLAATANAIVGLAPDYRPVGPDEIVRFECRAKSARFTLDDVAAGRIRLFFDPAGDL
jgi:hypothetical protein